MASNFKDEFYQDSLEHHGVKGMKWGVRRSKQQLGYSMTKRDAKKAIKEAKRTYRKSSGVWRTTGKNVSKVDKKVEKEIENDPVIQYARRRQQQALSGSTRAYALQKTNERRGNEKSSEYWKKQQERRNYQHLDSAVMEEERRLEIGKKYEKQYKEAVVKDLGIKDIERGKKMLDDYNLTNKALPGRF